MYDLARGLTRRQFLRATGAAAATVGLGGIAAACSAGSNPTTVPSASPGGSASAAPPTPAPTGTLNWMTWADHYYPAQLDEIVAANGIKTSITELADDSDGFTKLKEVRGQLDMMSADALWVPKYFEEGLVEAWDLGQLDVSKQLYSIAREFAIWTTPQGYLGYPIGWSPTVIYYDPAHVSPAPDSWEVLFDPKYKKRVGVQNMPTEVMAYMGLAAGVKDPYNMTTDEIAQAKAMLIKLKPNLTGLFNQGNGGVAALKSGEIWVCPGNLGWETRVKEQGGPDLKVLVPKEGTVGWMDAEMIVKGGENQNLILPFLELAEQAEYIAANFMLNRRPLFNEKAYKLLINQGQQETADRYLYNKPETLNTMKLMGPGANTQVVLDAWNEVMGS